MSESEDSSQELLFSSQLFNCTQDSAHNSGDESDVDFEVCSQSQTSHTNGNSTSNPTLLKVSITDTEKRQIGQKYQQTMKRVKELEDSRNICEGVKVLSLELEKQNKYFRSGGVNENMHIDAKCMLDNTTTTKQFVKCLQTDSKKFDCIEFAEKLLIKLNASASVESDDSDDGSQGVAREEWVAFGKTFCRFQKKVPAFHFIHGTFESNDDEVRPTKSRAVRAPKPVLSDVTHATQIDPKTKVNDESTPMEVDLIMDTVKKLEKRNECDLPYFALVINPNSMAQSVENLFHSAFLVKEGKTKLYLDDEDIPTLCSIEENDKQVNENENDVKGLQTVFSFSIDDWKALIQRYEIKKAAIKHPKN